MSLEAVAAVLNHSRAKGVSRNVLTAIAWHLGDNVEEGCYPSQARLAVMAGTNIRQVQRAIKNLQELEEIEYISHDGAGRPDRRTNRYYILLDCPEGCDRSLQHRSRPDIYDITTRHLRRHDPTFTPSRPDNNVVLNKQYKQL
jgi:hypothetical protein